MFINQEWGNNQLKSTLLNRQQILSRINITVSSEELFE